MGSGEKPEYRAVVAMASNRVIGKQGRLPWNLPADLAWFKKLTWGHPVVMGRRTMESIGRALPGRRNIVISRSLKDPPPGFELAGRIDDLEDRCGDETLVSIIGGAEIYRLLLPRCEEVYLSYVYHPYDGDTLLPPFEDQFVLAEIVYCDEDFELRRYRQRDRVIRANAVP